MAPPKDFPPPSSHSTPHPASVNPTHSTSRSSSPPSGTPASQTRRPPTSPTPHTPSVKHLATGSSSGGDSSMPPQTTTTTTSTTTRPPSSTTSHKSHPKTTSSSSSSSNKGSKPQSLDAPSKGVPAGAIAAAVIVGLIVLIIVLHRLWRFRARRSQQRANVVPLPPVRSLFRDRGPRHTSTIGEKDTRADGAGTVGSTGGVVDEEDWESLRPPGTLPGTSTRPSSWVSFKEKGNSLVGSGDSLRSSGMGAGGITQSTSTPVAALYMASRNLSAHSTTDLDNNKDINTNENPFTTPSGTPTRNRTPAPDGKRGNSQESASSGSSQLPVPPLPTVLDASSVNGAIRRSISSAYASPGHIKSNSAGDIGYGIGSSSDILSQHPTVSRATSPNSSQTATAEIGFARSSSPLILPPASVPPYNQNSVNSATAVQRRTSQGASSLYSRPTSRAHTAYNSNNINSPYGAMNGPSIRGAPHLPHVRAQVEIVLPKPLAPQTPAYALAEQHQYNAGQQQQQQPYLERGRNISNSSLRSVGSTRSISGFGGSGAAHEIGPPGVTRTDVWTDAMNGTRHGSVLPSRAPSPGPTNVSEKVERRKSGSSIIGGRERKLSVNEKTKTNPVTAGVATSSFSDDEDSSRGSALPPSSWRKTGDW